MSDEAHFHLCGVVNKQNYRFWASEQPSLLHKTPLHSAKVTVWCGITSFGILGPYFFEEHTVTVTVTSERYVEEMLNNFLPTELLRLGVHDKDLWYPNKMVLPAIQHVFYWLFLDKCFRIV